MAAALSSWNHEREVDQEIWQACAGILVDIPKVNSLVYYFPQGHMEHASSLPNECALLLQYYGSVLCRRVANVSYHANPHTDQVFVKFLLKQWNTDDPISNRIQMGNNDIVSFVKVLSKKRDIRHLICPLRQSLEIAFFHIYLVEMERKGFG